MGREKKPTNIAIAIYLANNYYDKMKSDDDFKKVAAIYNMKWRVLKRNFESVCMINALFDN